MRGALIVFEGCDRAGKTSQCRDLVKNLLSCSKKAEYINFPDRSTKSGHLINEFLTNKQDFSSETIHLLFTINRWEAKSKMESLLNAGTTLIVDRYSYSGVAYSAAKGLDLEWCKAPEAGLLKPDLVIFLHMTAEAIAKRGGFGDERYEIPEFQQKVYKSYELLKDSEYWKIINADKSREDLQKELYAILEKTIENIGNKQLETLW